jgi:hypothetical protein
LRLLLSQIIRTDHPAGSATAAAPATAPVPNCARSRPAQADHAELAIWGKTNNFPFSDFLISNFFV